MNGGDICKYIEKQLKLVKANFAEASVEGVHDLRVASRRLEEPLSLCGEVCGSKTVARTAKQLKRIRTAFRHVRELDVLGESLGEGLGKLNLTQRTLLQEAVSERREAEYRRAAKKIDRSQLDCLKRGSAKALKQVKNRKAAAADWEAGLRSLLGERVDAVLAHDPMQRGARDLHPTRIAVKRLRYAVELSAALEKDSDLSELERLKAAQDRLGDWNDHLTAARIASKIARKRAVLLERPEWTAAVLDYAAERVKLSRDLGEVFRSEWPELRGSIAGMPNGAAERLVESHGF